MTSVCMLLQGHYETDIRVRRKAEALAAAGYDVDVLALRSSFNRSKTYTLNGVNVRTLSLGKNRGSLIRYAFEYGIFFSWSMLQLSPFMRRLRYDIIDVNTLPDFLVFACAFAKWAGAKVVLDMHEITPEFYISKYKISATAWPVRLLKRVEKASMRYADRVITINEPIQALLEGRGLQRSKSTIIMNSADESLFSRELETAPMTSRDAESSPAFAFMYHGTLTAIYGLDIAIEAFALAHERMPGAEYWILGSGSDQAALEGLARRLRVAEKIRFIDPVLPQEVHRWLRRCDAGVLSTRQDVFLDYSFSNKLSEYVIMGKAIIASRLRTIGHYFSEDALLFFEPGDPSELAERMVTLYRDPALCERLATAAWREFEPIRWDIMKQRYLQLIAELASTRSRPDESPAA